MDPESNQEANEDICCVCFGLYKDDIDESGCVLADREWIQCSSKDCGLWSHVCCLEETDEGYNCAICQNVFIYYFVLDSVITLECSIHIISNFIRDNVISLQ